MSLVLIILFLTIILFVTNDPILIAIPYPFNTSKSSHIECFSNDQGMILSLTIVVQTFDTDGKTSSMQQTKDNIIKNDSISLMIFTSFNYSQLQSKIECRSKYHHGQQKLSQLAVLSVVEIPQKEFLSINTYRNQMVTIQCRTYGTNVIIQWDFTDDLAKNVFNSLPIGIRIGQKYTINDTLIIDHVSYSDHHGYYRCYATNELLGITYEDKSIIYLNVRKSSIWIPIVIVCAVIGLCILLLIICSKYWKKRRRRKSQLEENRMRQNDKEIMEKIKQIIQNRDSIEGSPYDNNEINSEQMESNIDILEMKSGNVQTLSHSDNSNRSQISLLSTQKQRRTISKPLSTSQTSSQFVLGNPFLEANAQFLNSMQINLNNI